ncbi:MAG: potassium channel family protein [Mesorhizobium sp.]|uniref:Ion transporter n=1 Tax=Mesorhizobium mediterraneum TaxID=43617 RepID=A0AB36RAE9_9HYPH|nr:MULTISPECIES: potassium channel family protein [Mesorhizobium]RUU33194.1 ion transporter [Mesorhizobium sp. M6A.T.Ca.TU.002.02.2.1]AZO68137.1 ion transporter [Mesorhizobium sp. M6A.T.Cr.TU.016.01.1.1]PAQ01434.1 ion transporter [Mesorhizobium mediterraneum]RUU26083.1 ion transporter [Mesorhizobium sp. M6A.T.Ce.TU.016.01.1.1]RUU43513.1 ion transporter [Mesorhizobium sp. M6A.T.Ce.TU.002.03.1.1]
MKAADKDGARELSALARLRDTLRKLYHGRTPAAFRFQLAAIIIDLAIIAFFIATPVIQESSSFLWLDYSVAALVAADMIARLLASNDMLRLLKQPASWIDAFILLTLLMPSALANLGFLRILRLWSLSRSGALWRYFEMRGLKKWREASHAVINLLTFLFVVTGFVYTFFFRTGAGLEGYVDALYFTVATVTTTGFGDIVLPGIAGKLTAIVTMIIGISLFVRLAQALFRPAKVFFPCPQCGLQRHEPDAVHCKACGHLLKIPDDGI